MDDLSDLIDLYVKDALKATGTREGDRREVPVAPITATLQVSEPESWGGFTSEVETATDADAGDAVEELHVALMVAQQPELPRVTFVKPSRLPAPPPQMLDLDDEITNVVYRFG